MEKSISDFMELFSGKGGEIRLEIIRLLPIHNNKIKMRDLQEKLKSSISSRGSLKHHLKILEKKNYILPLKRSKKEYGRPTYVLLNQEQQKNGWDEFKKISKENKKINLNNPITKEILNQLRTKLLKDEELGKKVKDKLKLENYSEVYSLLLWLRGQGFVETFSKITPEGKRFLKEELEKQNKQKSKKNKK